MIINKSLRQTPERSTSSSAIQTSPGKGYQVHGGGNRDPPADSIRQRVGWPGVRAGSYLKHIAGVIVTYPIVLTSDT